MKFNNTDFATDYSGSAGSATYSRGKGGPYRKLKSNPTNPNTIAQQAVRTEFAVLSQAWRGLTDEQRATWNSQAVNYPYIDSIGNTKIPSGFQLFKSLNGNLAAVGQPAINTIGAPLSVPVDSDITATCSAAANAIVIGLDEDEVQSEFLTIWATPPVSASIANAKNQSRQILVAEQEAPEATVSSNLTAAYQAKYGDFTGLEGKVVYFSFYSTNSQGQYVTCGEIRMVIAA